MSGLQKRPRIKAAAVVEGSRVEKRDQLKLRRRLRRLESVSAGNVVYLLGMIVEIVTRLKKMGIVTHSRIFSIICLYSH